MQTSKIDFTDHLNALIRPALVQLIDNATVTTLTAVRMPKTLADIKKQSNYSADFQRGIDYLKITWVSTPPVVAAIEKLIRAPPRKHPALNELERFAQVAQKYMHFFVSGSFFETLQATADVCTAVAKQEREAQLEAFQRVVTPMKSWLQEDYPRLMKDVKKCYLLKDKMDRAMACTEARKTPERIAKAVEAKKKHDEFFERVKNEVLRYKAVHRHHMQCLKVLMLQSYNFERKAKDQFAAAYLKCETEIGAGVAALKERKAAEESDPKISDKASKRDAQNESDLKRESVSGKESEPDTK